MEFSISDGFTTTIRRSTKELTGQVDPWVLRVLSACELQPLKSSDIQEIAGIRHRETSQRNYLDHLLREDLLERTIPDKPQSRLQKYRLTAKGLSLLNIIRSERQETNK
ncbi:MAG: Fic family protein [Armatimonadota bacterium]